MAKYDESLGDLKISELRLLIELSQTPSLRELARRQAIHPSLLSKIVRKVEVRVGHTLVTRSAQGMRFTMEGDHFLKSARRIVDLAGGLRAGAEKESEETATTYGFAAHSFIHRFLVPTTLSSPPLREFESRFRLLELSSKEFIVAGINGFFEIGLHLGKLDWPRSWVSHRIGMVRSKLYGRRGHPLGSSATVAELKKYPFVMPVRLSKNGTIAGEDFCPLPRDERIEGDSTATAGTSFEYVRRTDQITFAQEIAARDGVKRGELLEIKVAEWGVVSEPLYLAVHRALLQELPKGLK
jgi:DNA-binding transcriptional LysR family regulator